MQYGIVLGLPASQDRSSFHTLDVAGWSGVATGRRGGEGGAEHHQEDEREVEQDQRPPFVEIPELAGDQQGGGQGDELAQVLVGGPDRW